MRCVINMSAPRMQVNAMFGGEVATYGADSAQNRAGRRFYVPEYRYTDRDGVDLVRVLFTAEGPRGDKARVYAEMSSGTCARARPVVLVCVCVWKGFVCCKRVAAHTRSPRRRRRRSRLHVPHPAAHVLRRDD